MFPTTHLETPTRHGKCALEIEIPVAIALRRHPAETALGKFDSSFFVVVLVVPGLLPRRHRVGKDPLSVLASRFCLAFDLAVAARHEMLMLNVIKQHTSSLIIASNFQDIDNRVVVILVGRGSVVFVALLLLLLVCLVS